MTVILSQPCLGGRLNRYPLELHVQAIRGCSSSKLLAPENEDDDIKKTVSDRYFTLMYKWFGEIPSMSALLAEYQFVIWDFASAEMKQKLDCSEVSLAAVNIIPQLLNKYADASTTSDLEGSVRIYPNVEAIKTDPGINSIFPQLFACTVYGQKYYYLTCKGRVFPLPELFFEQAFDQLYRFAYVFHLPFHPRCKRTIQLLESFTNLPYALEYPSSGFRRLHDAIICKRHKITVYPDSPLQQAEEEADADTIGELDSVSYEDDDEYTDESADDGSTCTAKSLHSSLDDFVISGSDDSASGQSSSSSEATFSFYDSEENSTLSDSSAFVINSSDGESDQT